MAEAINSNMAQTRYAVVTGANKGIGFEICKQLLSKGITVLLTARDSNRGLEAVREIKDSSDHGISSTDRLVFHPLDVADPSSIDSLAKFVESQFGKLDILVNNAGVSGAIVDAEKLRAAADAIKADYASVNWDEIMTQTYDEAYLCLQTNYYGPKRLTEALFPLLKLSDSPRIVNVSSASGKLKFIPNEWAKKILRDEDNLSEGIIDKVLDEFLNDFKEGNLSAKGWPSFLAAYTISKAALTAYTKVIAKKYEGFKVNSVCPGYVRTDINGNTGTLTAVEGAAPVVRLALLGDGGPSGLFFVRDEVSSED